jgi:Zn-dependent protease
VAIVRAVGGGHLSGASSSYHYTIPSPVATVSRPTVSPTELTNLLVAFTVLTFDFVLIQQGPTLYQGPLLEPFAIAAAAALTGFVAHEMAHKFSAQARGYWAEFRLSGLGLLVSLITASAGFLFAAPGATMIGGMSNVQDWGRTALAGPTSNFLFALAFLGGAFGAASFPAGQSLAGPLFFLAFINAWFGAFNLIPFGPLDGAKVFRWSKGIWAGTFLLFGGLAAVLFYFVGFA